MNARRSALHASLVLVLVLAPLALCSVPLSAQRAIARQISLGSQIEHGYGAGTRDTSGSPDRNYRQQTVDDSIRARLDGARAKYDVANGLRWSLLRHPNYDIQADVKAPLDSMNSAV